MSKALDYRSIHEAQHKDGLSHWRIARRSDKSLTICLVRKLTRCHMGSSWRLIATSKDLCKALSRVQSAMSSPVFAFFSSPIQISTHSRTAFWISRILSLIGTSSSITSAFRWPSRASATVTWKRGHKEVLRRKRLRMEFARGANPVVNGSGASEKAFRNPRLLCSRYARIMKASIDVAAILYVLSMSSLGAQIWLLTCQHEARPYQ